MADIQLLQTTLHQYLETFDYTRWKQVFGYTGRLKDTHFFCGYITYTDKLEVLIRTTKTQQLKAKKTLSQAYVFPEAKLWTQVFITSLVELESVLPFIQQAYEQVKTLKREKSTFTEKY